MDSLRRDNHWLAERLCDLHATYFPDVVVSNTLFVRFGRTSKTRLGSIIARPMQGYTQAVTFININGLLRDAVVPDFVIDGTLLHEFTHYAQGFHSPHPQFFHHPHRGDVVNKEIRRRGAGSILAQQLSWIKEEYPGFLRSKGLL